MKITLKHYIILVLIALTTAGCFGKNKAEKLAPELAADGIKYYQDEKYERAIKSFKQLKDWYPFDKLSILAEFKIAESYYKMDKYEDAIVAYQLFEQLHPRNEAVDYTIYQIGMCYYNRIDTIDRDQKNTLMALKTFRRLMRQHPKSDYAKKGADKIQTCLKSLAGHEIYIGDFYFNSEHYKAAKKRYRTVLAAYPNLGFDAKAKEMIIKCDRLIKEAEKNKDKKSCWLLGFFCSNK